MYKRELSRRDFLRLSGVTLGGFALGSLPFRLMQTEFPLGVKLGRVCVGRTDLKSGPDPESQTLGAIYEDAVLPWIKEVVGRNQIYGFSNQRWVETPQGYIYGPYLQPVYNIPNQPVDKLISTSLGEGMWAEVTVPYVDAALDRAPSSNSWIKYRLEDGLPIRLYYKQIFWIDQVKTDAAGNVLYRLNPNYYGGVDMLWVDARALRPLSEIDLEPIHPEIENKRILVDVNRQTLNCFEGETEVYFCRVSTGAKFDMNGNLVDRWETPVGKHHVTRKFISLQMSGGTTGAGYDLPGIGWSSIFATGGVAIHSTFWHNNFGDPVSHGCVNTAPEDAHWIWRWMEPSVTYDPGMIDTTVTGESSTEVSVVEI